MLRITDTLQRAQRSVQLALDTRRRGARQHRVDRRRDELDVTELLRRDAAEEVVERPRALPRAEVEGLKRVVQPGGHLTELAAEQLLHGCRAVGIRMGWRRQFNAEAVDA